MSSIISTPDFKSYTNIAQRHKDENGNIIAVEVEEKHIVDKNNITLSQIPHPHLGLEVKLASEYTKMIEVKSNELIENQNQFKVDYTTGLIWFDASLNTKEIVVKYWGMGLDLIHSSRVYTKTDETGEVVETLHDIITNGTAALKFLYDLPATIVEGREICKVIEDAQDLNDRLTSSIDLGTKTNNDLITTTEQGQELYFNLFDSVRVGSSLNLNLEENIDTASEINTSLASNIENSNGLIEETANVEAILQQLKQANDEAKDVIIPNIDRFDNAKYFIQKSDWVNNSVRVIHNLDSTNIIVATYSPNGESLTVPYRLIDDNEIEFYNETELDLTVIINVAYRGKLGDINGGSSNITQIQIMNINEIPEIKTNLNVLNADFAKHKANVDKDLSNIKDDLTREGLLNKLASIGGHNSNIDADKLDGKHSSDFIQNKYSNGYNGIVAGNDDQSFVRTTNLGIIPYREGSNSNLGTSTWRFKEGHIDNMYTVSGGLRLGNSRVFIQPTKPVGATSGDIWIKNG